MKTNTGSKYRSRECTQSPWSWEQTRSQNMNNPPSTTYPTPTPLLHTQSRVNRVESWKNRCKVDELHQNPAIVSKILFKNVTYTHQRMLVYWWIQNCVYIVVYELYEPFLKFWSWLKFSEIHSILPLEITTFSSVNRIYSSF